MSKSQVFSQRRPHNAKVYEVPGCPASDKMMVAALYYALNGGKNEN